MLKILIFTVIGLLLIYCLRPNKSGNIDTASPECNSNSLNRNNKCRSIIDMFRNDSTNIKFNEELYENDTIHNTPL